MKGLYQKYRIEKTDGTPVDQDAEYFVLRLDTDPHARVALRAYSDSVMNDNPELAGDLAKWCTSLDCKRERGKNDVQ